MILVALLAVSLEPLKERINSLIYHDAKLRSTEEKLIGFTAVHNPRLTEIQETLQDTGFYRGQVDGLMGKGTRQAVKHFEAKNKLKADGWVDEETLLALNRAKNEYHKTAPPMVIEDEIAKLAPSPKSRNDIPASPASVRLQWPTSAPEAHAARPRITKAKTIEPPKKIPAAFPPKGAARNRQVQQALTRAGHYKGIIDGKSGPRTRSAVIAFQKAQGLKADGVVGPRTWQELVKYLD
jgi:peptidoglycan hydrolase-like protein with peptidoglycan-binding domain